MNKSSQGISKPYEAGDSAEEKISSLEDKLELLEDQNREIEDQLVNANAEMNRYKQKVDRISRENEKLKQSPLFIATVEEITEDGAIIRQHGNNQEALTELTKELKEDLSAGDRVSVNNSLSIVDKLKGETDSRAQGMQVDHSPDVEYSDIGGVEEQLQEIREAVEMPLESPELFEEVGIQPPSGVLLHGPPGTGKTMLAKAVANKTDSAFISMAGSELVHKFIGEGSKLVRDIFDLARENEPAVIFIDEIDAIASKRTEGKTSGEGEVQRTMMQLLSEMDGFDDRGDIRIIAATNRFDMLDEAITRPGRFDRLIEVPHPDGKAREEIFQIHTEGMNVEDSVDFKTLADMTDGASGADVQAACTEAGMFAIRNGRKSIKMDDFLAAHEKVAGEDDSPGDVVVESGYAAFA